MRSIQEIKEANRLWEEKEKREKEEDRKDRERTKLYTGIVNKQPGEK